MKGKLTLYVTYEGSDANEATIKSVLQSMVEHAADRGLLTDGLNLTVEESTFDVEVEPESKPSPKWDALVARAEAELASEDLDGEVHDLHSNSASDVNNSGVSGQIDYLVENYGQAYAEQVLKDALGS